MLQCSFTFGVFQRLPVIQCNEVRKVASGNSQETIYMYLIIISCTGGDGWGGGRGGGRERKGRVELTSV